jgi:hypothetical protein
MNFVLGNKQTGSIQYQLGIRTTNIIVDFVKNGFIFTPLSPFPNLSKLCYEKDIIYRDTGVNGTHTTGTAISVWAQSRRQYQQFFRWQF